MKVKRLLFGIAISCMLFSCGRGDKGTVSSTQEPMEEGIRPETTKVSGPLGDAFIVVDKAYKPTTNDSGSPIIIEFERTDKAFPFNNEDEIEVFQYLIAKTGNIIGFGIELLDEEGNIIEKSNPRTPDYSDEQLTLIKIKPGEKGSLSFKTPIFRSDLEKVRKFRITSDYEYIEPEVETPSVNVTNPYLDYVNERAKQNEKYIKERTKQNEEYIKERAKQNEEYINEAKKRYGL